MYGCPCLLQSEGKKGTQEGDEEDGEEEVSAEASGRALAATEVSVCSVPNLISIAVGCGLWRRGREGGREGGGGGVMEEEREEVSE